MSVWTFLKDAYLGAFALLQRAAETLQSYWFAVLAVAVLCILIGWLARDQSVPVENEPPDPLSEDEQPLPRYVREVEYVAASAWAGREVWNEPREQESEERE